MSQLSAEPITEKQSSASEMKTTDLQPLSLIDFATNDYPSSESDDDESDISFCELLVNLSQCDEDLLLAQKGYKKLKTICHTLQGEIFTATTINTDNPSTVQIETYTKEYYKQNISLPDNNGMQFIVQDDAFKETYILQYIHGTRQRFITDRVVRQFQSFESKEYLFVVRDFSEVSLKEFCASAHAYIKTGKLKQRAYNKIVKYIAWQISVVLQWLHTQMNCCHLNLDMNNIKIENGEFVSKSNGYVRINPYIRVKICDFSKAEIFQNSDFNCFKYYDAYSQKSDVQYFSPKCLSEDVYDARAADMWAFGHILYECVFTERLYSNVNPKLPESEGGYWAAMTDNVIAYVRMNNLQCGSKMLSIISDLLTVNEKKRMNSTNILQSEWFKTYYKKYRNIIPTNFCKEKIAKMKNAPFYND